MEKIIFRLDKILKERNLTIYSFARDAKLNYVTVYRIVNNQTSGITLEMLARIASALGVSPRDLLEVETSKNKK